MVPPIIHVLRFRVRAAAGYRSVACCSSLSSFISLKYVYSWLIVCYCTCSKHSICSYSWINKPKFMYKSYSFIKGTTFQFFSAKCQSFCSWAVFSSKLFLKLSIFSSHQNFPTHINFQFSHHIILILTKLSILM